jgi:hypothetical protein
MLEFTLAKGNFHGDVALKRRGRRTSCSGLLVFIILLFACPAFPNSLSFTGGLAGPSTPFETTFYLAGNSNVIIQSWSFGGGTNAAGQAISPGGFDPMVSLFSGPEGTASIITRNGDPAADADTLISADSFVGNCPPAGTVTIGTGVGSTVCGDDFLNITTLSAGVYTLVLTDANYTPLAVNPGPGGGSTLLSDGFTDFTGGVFQTCNTTSDGTFCITPSAGFAVDIVATSGGLSSTPEPASLALLGSGLLALAPLCRRRQRKAAASRPRVDRSPAHSK